MYSSEIQKKKKDLQNQPQTIKKMAIGTCISIITLNVNGLNAPTKRHRLDECCLQETDFLNWKILVSYGDSIFSKM